MPIWVSKEASGPKQCRKKVKRAVKNTFMVKSGNNYIQYVCVCVCMCGTAHVFMYVSVCLCACVCFSVQIILQGLQSFQTATIVLAKVVPSIARELNSCSTINKSEYLIDSGILIWDSKLGLSLFSMKACSI